jgi:hypothetical protein
MDDLAVQFDSVLHDDRGLDESGHYVGYATVALQLTNGFGESVRIEMHAWNFPPGGVNGAWETVDTLGYYLSLHELSDLDGGSRSLPYSTYHLKLEVTPNTSGQGFDGVVIPMTISSQLDDIQQAPYRVGEASIVGDQLNLGINFGGGCRSHYFVNYLIKHTSNDSQTPEAIMVLCHYDNSDFCEAYISKSLSFDLTPVQRIYPESYPESMEGRQILIHIMDYRYDSDGLALRPVKSLVYSF